MSANTGAKLLDIVTTVNALGSSNGLAKINAWVDETANNTPKRFYGRNL